MLLLESMVAQDRVEERFCKRLFISLKGGRLTLIKSTLSSLPVFFVIVQYFKGSQIEARENSKGFPLGG